MPHPPSASGAPRRRGLPGGIIVPIAVVLLLVVAVCCVGGLVLVTREDDEPDRTRTSDESSTETTSETTSTTRSETSSETSTSTPPAAEGEPPVPSAEEAVAFPATFGGWKNLSSEPGSTIAIFMKGEESFNVLSSTHASVETYEELWDSPRRHGRVSCGEQVGASKVSCAVSAHETTYYATSSDLTEEELAGAVGTMITKM